LNRFGRTVRVKLYTDKVFTPIFHTNAAIFFLPSAFQDAPADGHPYVRMNNQWVRLPE